MNKASLIKSTLIISTFFLTGCVNKHGISAKYYSDCKEYYDLQGYYHKKCGEDDIITYKTMQKKLEETSDAITQTTKKLLGKEAPKTRQPNVW